MCKNYPSSVSSVFEGLGKSKVLQVIALPISLSTKTSRIQSLQPFEYLFFFSHNAKLQCKRFAWKADQRPFRTCALRAVIPVLHVTITRSGLGSSNAACTCGTRCALQSVKCLPANAASYRAVRGNAPRTHNSGGSTPDFRPGRETKTGSGGAADCASKPRERTRASSRR